MPNAVSGSHQRIGPSDQEPAGTLSPEYCRATAKYLADNGLDPEDVETVMEVLGRYQAEAAEDVGTTGTRGTFKGFGGMDALRRAMAADRALPPNLRRWPTPPMTARQQAKFEERFPGTDKIKVV